MNQEQEEVKEEKKEERKHSHGGGCCGGGGHGSGHGHHEAGQRRGFNGSRLILFAFLGIAGFFLLTEHRAHLFGFLPWLLLLACPLMHFFHKGHGGHGGQGGRSDSGVKPEGRY